MLEHVVAALRIFCGFSSPEAYGKYIYMRRSERERDEQQDEPHVTIVVLS